MRMPLALIALAVTTATTLPTPAYAHQPGACVPAGLERCERWAATYDDATIAPPYRSDQFAQQVLVNDTTVFTVVRDVAHDTRDAYASKATTLVVAADRATGATRWTTTQAHRHYLSVHNATLSPDGARLYLSGAAYDGYVVGATDSVLTTTAIDAASGAILWTTHWDNLPNGTDGSKGIVADATRVYVTGVTTPAGGGLDYVTLAYDAATGAIAWTSTYAGPRSTGQDAPFGIALAGGTVAVTGWSDGTVEFDADYATVAYDAATGAQRWVRRYDGVGAHKSDRAMAIAADADTFYVTGDSWAGTSGAGYDYATVAYAAADGAQRWASRWSGGRGGFNSPDSVAVHGGTVVVTGQATAASADDGNDAGTVAYDAATGAARWQALHGAPRHDDYGKGLAVAGGTAYVVTTDVPLVPYTSLAHVQVVAYDLATGGAGWRTRLDGRPGDALAAAGIATDGTDVAVTANATYSASPLKPPTQNVYDAVTAIFAG
ncbi:MAG TPA: PQQ-binding-like beta-propeller repeat protein [Mycobacteriales bacterium]|jgi:hypothetical protein